MDSIINLEFFAKGGPLMYALLACSVLSVAMILERLFALKRSRIFRRDLLKEVEIAIKRNDLPAAIEWCQKDRTPMMQVAQIALINADKEKMDLKAAIEEAGRMEVPRLERFLTSMQTIAVISPLLGLLGTVTGMIRVFETIVANGAGNTQLLAGGISEALITTASGLTVAIPTLIFYNYLSKKVDHILVEMEGYALTIYELLTNDYSEL